MGVGFSTFPESQPKRQLNFQNLHWIVDLIKIRLDFGYLLNFNGFNLKFYLKNPQGNQTINV